MTTNPVFAILLGRTIARAQGVSDAEATRLGLLGALVTRRPVLGLVLVSAIARREAASAAAGTVTVPTLQLAATSLGSGDVRLSWAWSPSAPPGSLTYTVRRSTSSGKEKTLGQGQGQDLVDNSYTDSEVTVNKTYYYVVDVLDDSDNRIGTSNEVRLKLS